MSIVNRGILACLYVSLYVGLDVEGETSARGVSWGGVGVDDPTLRCQRDCLVSCYKTANAVTAVQVYSVEQNQSHGGYSVYSIVYKNTV